MFLGWYIWFFFVGLKGILILCIFEEFWLVLLNNLIIFLLILINWEWLIEWDVGLYFFLINLGVLLYVFLKRCIKWE